MAAFLALATTAAVRRGDREALMALFNLMGGSNWTKNRAWDPDGVSDPCAVRWHGVGCYDPCDPVLDREVYNPLMDKNPKPVRRKCRKGRIHSIDLRGNNLRGNIADWTAIGELHNLTWLDLASNDINGSLPTELGRIQQLEHLDLAHNQIEGHLPPATFGSLNAGGPEHDPTSLRMDLQLGDTEEPLQGVQLSKKKTQKKTPSYKKCRGFFLSLFSLSATSPFCTSSSLLSI